MLVSVNLYDYIRLSNSYYECSHKRGRGVKSKV